MARQEWMFLAARNLISQQPEGGWESENMDYGDLLSIVDILDYAFTTGGGTCPECKSPERSRRNVNVRKCTCNPVDEAHLNSCFCSNVWHRERP